MTKTICKNCGKELNKVAYTAQRFIDKYGKEKWEHSWKSKCSKPEPKK